MKCNLWGYIRKGRRQKRTRTKTYADNSDDYGGRIFKTINRTAKFIRNIFACEFGCFCFLRSCENIRAPPILRIEKLQKNYLIRRNKKCVQKNFLRNLFYLVVIFTFLGLPTRKAKKKAPTF